MKNNKFLPPYIIAMEDIIKTAEAAGILTKEEAEEKLLQLKQEEELISNLLKEA